MSSAVLRVGLAILLSSWALLLFGGCLHADSYWPLFNVFFLALGALPAVFGAVNSQGLWGAIGDFATGVVFCSVFAFPLVLKNAEIIPVGSVVYIWVGNFALVAAAYLVARTA